MAKVPAFLTNLFGWTSSSPPKDTPRKGDIDDTGFGFNSSAYDQYSNFVKPPFERRRKYDIYDEMDEMPEISSVLTAYAEDCTQYDRERKAAIWITANKEEVKSILNDLRKRLQWEEFVEAIARDIGKYGDDFAQLEIDGDHITGWDWKDPRDIERIENRDGTLVGFELSAKLQAVIADMKSKESGSITFTYKPWDIVHWRLYRRKREVKQKFRNIYGTSLLAGAERIAKMVKILDDMIMVRRLTKSLDYRVYQIDTGRSGVEEEIMILKRWKNSLKRKPYIDPTSQKMSMLFDPWTFQEDIFWAKGNDTKSSVEVIPGNPNPGEIVDIEHLENKLFGALRAPKAYFGFEGDVNAKATLSSQDMKWGRSANSLQRALKNGFIRLCQIQLALKGIDPKAPENRFEINMVVPSVLEDLSRLEATQTMIDAAERMVSLGSSLELDKQAWNIHVMSAVLGFSREEIEQFMQVEIPDPENPDDDKDASLEGPGKIDEIMTSAIKRKISEVHRVTHRADPDEERILAEELPSKDWKMPVRKIFDIPETDLEILKQ